LKHYPLVFKLLSGPMDDLTQFWNEIAARPSGPLAMRFYLQPLMATIFAVRDGLKDARLGNPAYFWSLFTNPADRRERLAEGWHSIRKIFILAVVLDLIYGLLVLHAFRPVQTLLIASILALGPYIVIRGPVNRIAKAMQRPKRTRRAA
jgi:hypothetical protein